MSGVTETRLDNLETQVCIAIGEAAMAETAITGLEARLSLLEEQLSQLLTQQPAAETRSDPPMYPEEPAP